LAITVDDDRCRALITDSQAWRAEVAGLPGLTASSPSATADFYPRDELARIIAYAAERFVTVVPEFDVPGHVAAAFTWVPRRDPGRFGRRRRCGRVDVHFEDR
jgi:N-acetyl-beta-hexosaminidase